MKGFTLVEMLVALLVFAILAAAGVAVMGFAVDNQAVVRDRTERLGRLQTTRAILKADLEQAATRRTRGEDGQPALGPFAGGGERVVLALTRRGWDNPDQDPRSSLQYVEYDLAEGRLERRTRGAPDGAALGRPQVLIDGVESLRIAFFSRGEWRDVWTPSPTAPLPQAVRLDLALRDSGEVSQLFIVPGDGP